ncbi:hypothetical protein GCM10010441_72530 [Kitasatospora paracochleata]|uniref:Uncharacterized protein n=1 Tax=Kitasatospora paracochleata TaxID=58354 RepID=A0ABT1JBE3_9ACTN|nr:hypothetical protein [Kitasatospora paracochleata]MCP2313991.1 hypothetical protein [Kitasatospora paracochleata]
MPRTALQRFNRAKTDSGWPLLLANFALFVVLGAYSLNAAASGSFLFTVLSVNLVLGALRTGHVMLCVAQGKTGLTATGERIAVDVTTDPSQRARLF